MIVTSPEASSTTTVAAPIDGAAAIVIRGSAVRKRAMSRGMSERLMSVVAPIGVFLLWELLADTHIIDTRFFPAPSSIVGTFGTLIANGQLWANTWISLERLFIGFLFGAIPALAIGLTMGLYRPIRVLVDPLILGTYPIPKSAILPLILPATAPQPAWGSRLVRSKASSIASHGWRYC